MTTTGVLGKWFGVEALRDVVPYAQCPEKLWRVGRQVALFSPFPGRK